MPTPSHYWFVPRRHLFVPKQGQHHSLPLRRADSPLQPGVDQIVQPDAPFSIVVKSVYVADNYDREKSGNDLLVRSWVRYGDEPEIEVLHTVQADIPAQTVLHPADIVAPHVFARERHAVDHRVWVKLQVLDIDSRKYKQMAQALSAEKIGAIAQHAGAIFPGTLPFISAIPSVVGEATELFQSIQTLVSNKDDLIMERSLDFSPPNSGETPFRYGAYVLFSQQTQAHRHRLRDFVLEPAVNKVSETVDIRPGARMPSNERPSNERPPHETSDPEIPDYVVIEVIPAVVASVDPATLFVQQQLATGLRFPDGRTTDSDRFEHLQALFKQATQVDDLLDYRRLAQRHREGLDLNGFESKRLLDLEQKLSGYIGLISEILDEPLM